MNWDEEVDFVVVGSGAGAMTAAWRAHKLGASVLVLEKTDLFGGSTAMSGGAMWVPCNHQIAGRGIDDSRDDALTYLRGITKGRVADDRIVAYVDTAPEMLRELCTHTHLRIDSLESYPDYYVEADGGKPGGRTVEPVPYHGKYLGSDLFDQLRPSQPQMLIEGRVGLTAREAHIMVSGSWKMWVLIVKHMLSYFLDFGRKGRRGRRLTLGNALMGRLRKTLLDEGIPVRLETSVDELVIDDGRVEGVVVTHGGETNRIRGRKGVLLAAGGFARSQKWRDEHLPGPTNEAWSAANPGNVGDGIRMGMEAGGAIDLMDEAWWTPVTMLPGKDYSWILVVEKSMPGSMMVNKAGRRFTNEAAPYVDVVHATYDAHSEETPSIPAWLVFDARYRKYYPVGPLPPGRVQPDSRTKRKWLEDFLVRAKTVRELAEKIEVDPDGLEDEVAKNNRFAKTGKDEDFGRGDAILDRYYSDPRVKPNPNLAPIETAPYYAIRVYPGDLGTKGGLLTDAHGRVLREDGTPIEGLYATGNCSSAVMGDTYPGAGGTIGPAMTFGWIAAAHATSRQ
jgi:3-oxosteroid 1-dehydrogenase